MHRRRGVLCGRVLKGELLFQATERNPTAPGGLHLLLSKVLTHHTRTTTRTITISYLGMVFSGVCDIKHHVLCAWLFVYVQSFF